MEPVRLLNRKGRKRRHFVNPERTTELPALLPASAYRGHATDLQDDWPADTDPWHESEDSLQPFDAHIENAKEIHYHSLSSQSMHDKLPQVRKFKNISNPKRYQNPQLQNDISSNSSNGGLKQFKNKDSEPLVERSVNVLENISVLNMVDSITQSFTKALTNQSKVHSEACADLCGLIHDVVGVNRELGSVVVDGVQKQTMLMSTFLHPSSPQTKDFCNTKKDATHIYRKEDTTNEIFHTKNIFINNNQHFHSNTDDCNDEEDYKKSNELISSQKLHSCGNDLFKKSLMRNDSIFTNTHTSRQNQIVIVELPLEHDTLSINDTQNSNIDFSCQFKNDIDSKSTLVEQSIKNIETLKTKASQTENDLHTEEQCSSDHFESVLYNQPKVSFGVQTIDFVSQSKKNCNEKVELNDSEKFESEEIKSIKESFKIDSNINPNMTIENFEEQEMTNASVNVNKSTNKFYKHDIIDADISTSIYNINCHFDNFNLIEIPINTKNQCKCIETSSNNLKDNINDHSNSKISELDETSVFEWHESMMYTNKYDTTVDKYLSNKTSNNCSSDNIIKSNEGCCNVYDFDEFENDLEITSSTKDDEHISQAKISNDSFKLETIVSQQHLHINEDSLYLESISDVPMWDPLNEKTPFSKLNHLSQCNASETKYSFEEVSIGGSFSTNESSTFKKIEVDTTNNDKVNVVEPLIDNNDLSKTNNETYYSHKDILIDESSSINDKSCEESKNKKLYDFNTQDLGKTLEVSMSKTNEEKSKEILRFKVKDINNSVEGLQVAGSKSSSSWMTFTKTNPITQKHKNGPIWGRFFSAVLKNFKRRMNVAAIKIQSYYSGFRCRRLVWLQKGWKYQLGAQFLGRMKSKGNKKTPTSFLPSCAPCIDDGDDVIIPSCFRHDKKNSINLDIKSTYSEEMNNIEVKSKSNYYSSIESKTKSLNNDLKTICEGSSKGQIHRCYEKNSSQGQVHLCQSRQSFEGPLVYICYEKQSSQHQVHVCLNKQPSEDDIRSIQEHNLKIEEETKTNNVKMEKVWNSLEEKDFMASLACNLKNSQKYLMNKSSLWQGPKVTKRLSSSINIYKLNAPKTSKCLDVNVLKKCVACRPPKIEYCEDCIVYYCPPIHSCSKSCLVMKKEALASRLVMATMKEMTLKLSKLKHSAISLDLELKKIEQMRHEMAPIPAHDMLKSKPYSWPLLCTKLQGERFTDLANCKIRSCGHAHVHHQSTHQILQQRHQHNAPRVP